MARNSSLCQASILLLLVLISGTLFSASAQRRNTKPKPPQPRPADPVKETPAPPPPPPEPKPIKPPETPLAVEEMENLQAVIETSMGDITLDFYPKVAPNHVRQFVWLAREGYFDGMSFSRVLPKFIIQSGNPASRSEERRVG